MMATVDSSAQQMARFGLLCDTPSGIAVHC